MRNFFSWLAIYPHQQCRPPQILVKELEIGIFQFQRAVKIPKSCRHNMEISKKVRKGGGKQYDIVHNYLAATNDIVTPGTYILIFL